MDGQGVDTTFSVLDAVLTTVLGMECSRSSPCFSTASPADTSTATLQELGTTFSSQATANMEPGYPTTQLSLVSPDFSSATASAQIPDDPIPRGIMSNWQKRVVDIYLIIVFGIFLCSFGIVTNAMNLVVYTRQRKKDTVSLSLTYLSVSDMGVLLGSLFSCLCYATFRIDPFSPVDAMSLQYVIGAQVRHMFINISLLTTVFVCVERCLCVVMPLKVKFLVGTRRTHAANIFFYVFIFAVYIPDFISKSLDWKHDPRANATRLMVTFAKNRKTMEHIKDSINHIMLPFVGQIIVTAATLLMISALTASSRFRHKNRTDNSAIEVPAFPSASAPAKTESGSWRQMSSRDKRVVRMVTIISTIFIVCNLPMVVGMSCRRAFPEFKINGVYHNVHLTVFAVVYLASSLSAAVNFFVYYFGSSKFKQSFHEIFCRGGAETEGRAQGTGHRDRKGERGGKGGRGEEGFSGSVVTISRGSVEVSSLSRLSDLGSKVDVD